MTIYRAEVASDRFVANHIDHDAQEDRTVQITNLWRARCVALMGIVESCGKTTVAIVAYLARSVAEKILGGDWKSAIYSDVVEEQFYSGCYMFHAVISPNSGLQKAWRASNNDTLDWGTNYSPTQTTLWQTLGVVGAIQA